MRFRFNFQNKDILLEDVILCKGFFSKLRGLMFRRGYRPAIFIFKKPEKMGIHSCFVYHKFLAIWMRKGKFVAKMIVKPWNLFIQPKERFDCLIEVPFKSEKEIMLFLVGSEKGLKTLNHT